MKLDGALRRLLVEATNLVIGGLEKGIRVVCVEKVLYRLEVERTTSEFSDGIVVFYVEVLNSLALHPLEKVDH